jgi:hypothetical protein
VNADWARCDVAAFDELFDRLLVERGNVSGLPARDEMAIGHLDLLETVRNQNGDAFSAEFCHTSGLSKGRAKRGAATLGLRRRAAAGAPRAGRLGTPDLCADAGADEQKLRPRPGIFHARVVARYPVQNPRKARSRVRFPGSDMTLLSPHWLLPTCIVFASSGCGEGASHVPASGGSSGSSVSRAGSSAGVAAGFAGTYGGAASGAGSSGVGGGGFAGTTGGTAPRAGASGGGSGAVTGAAGSLAAAGAFSQGGSPAGGATSIGSGGAGAPTAGAGGAVGTEVKCSFEISGNISADIPTVGVVDWSTDLAALTAARIEFSLDDAADNESNVGSRGPISPSEPQALLLGLKPDRPYTYRIVATAGDSYCVSDDQKIRTQPDPDAPALTLVQGESFATRADGFVVTSTDSDAVIIDSDGIVVWRTDVGTWPSRAHMDWDGEYMWAASGTVAPSDLGTVTRVRMDGSDAEQIPGLGSNHHDFAVLPGGTTAFLMWTGDKTQQTSDLVERSPDGTLRTVATLDGTTLLTSATSFHANALRYYARDDSYTVSDLYTQVISKMNRQGGVEWQVGGCAASSLCANTSFWGNHGHELLENGNLLYFSANYAMGHGMPSPVNEYSLSQQSGYLTATLEWSYEGQFGSDNFGDVQRLPNGNTLITYSIYYTEDSNFAQGTLLEVTPMGTVVRSVTGSTFGYSTFRPTLYGPPQ